VPSPSRSLEIVVPAAVPVERPTAEAVQTLAWALVRRRNLVFVVFAAFALAGAIVAAQQRVVYSASAKLLYKPDRTSLLISKLSPQSARSPYSPEKLKSEIELLKSRDVLLPVARALAADRGRPDDLELVESLHGQIASNLLPAAFPGTGILAVEYRDGNASEAVEILGRVVDSYKEHHAVAYGGSDALLEFYEVEAARTRSALEETEERYREWQAKNGVVSIDAQITALLAREAEQVRELELAASDRQLTLDRDVVLAKLRGDVATASFELRSLLQRYTEEDRRVREKREQIGILRADLAAAERTLTSTLAAREATIRAERARTAAALADLRTRKIEGDRFARDIAMHGESFRLYGRNVEEARVATKLDRDQLSELSVIEKPHLTAYTNRSERLGLFALSSAVGLALGSLLAIALAFFHRSLRTRRDVERHLDLPLLATIPDLRSLPI
jgi:uncharacterized protein involved in exopolysaccharide biosynthesis